MVHGIVEHIGRLLRRMSWKYLSVSNMIQVITRTMKQINDHKSIIEPSSSEALVSKRLTDLASGAASLGKFRHLAAARNEAEFQYFSLTNSVLILILFPYPRQTRTRNCLLQTPRAFDSSSQSRQIDYSGRLDVSHMLDKSVYEY